MTAPPDVCFRELPHENRESLESDPVWCCFGYGPGVCIRYERVGSGPLPLILLHGLAASRGTWDDLRSRFPEELYTLYLIDLVGFGRSSKPAAGEFGPLGQAAAILALLVELRLSGVVLIGHSFGGTVALLATLSAQRSAWRRLIRGVVLIGAPAWPQPLPRFLRYLRSPLLGTIILTLIPTRIVVTRALESVYHDRTLVDERHILRYADCFRGRGTVKALILTVRNLIPDQWNEYCAEYPRLEKPLLLIWGEHDRVVKLWQGERLRDTVPGSRLEIMARCGHNPHEEQPEATWKSIQRFLEEIAES